jgi:hypothetical protein
MARKAGGSESGRYVSWAAESAPASSPPAAGRWAAGRRALARRLENYSWVDAFVAVVAAAVVDLLGVLIVSGWQTAACGAVCGLRTQLHLMHVAAAWTLAVVVPLPLLVALLTRKARVAVAVVQVLLCLGAVVSAVSTEHRLVPRINGTAHCWNDLYSDAECPWGPKD